MIFLVSTVLFVILRYNFAHVKNYARTVHEYNMKENYWGR